MNSALNRREVAAAIVVMAAAVYALLKPIWDWDVIAYLALAKQLGGADWASVHSWTYETIRLLPDYWRFDLLGREMFRETVARDPEALRQVSAFYAERFGYYGVLRALMMVGVPALVGIQLLNGVALGFLARVVWAWLKKAYTSWGAVVGLAVVLFFPSVMKVLRWSNPDGLVAACYVAGIYAWIEGKVRWSYAAFGTMVLFKPNTLLWVAPLVLIRAWERNWSAAWSLALIVVAAAAVHAILPHYSPMVGWHHTFVGAFAYPEELRLPFSSDFYVHLLKARMLDLHGRDLLLFILMWLSLALLIWRGGQQRALLALAIVSGVGVQVLIFPGFWERLYVGPVLALVLLATPCLTGPTWAKAYKLGKTKE